MVIVDRCRYRACSLLPSFIAASALHKIEIGQLPLEVFDLGPVVHDDVRIPGMARSIVLMVGLGRIEGAV